MIIMVLPFAGMTRIRFQGSRPEASSQPVCADSPSTGAIVHPWVFFVKYANFRRNPMYNTCNTKRGDQLSKVKGIGKKK